MEIKNHWLRVLILVFYFFLIFIISRIIDLVLWYQQGYISHAIVDPLVLNVRQLKWLLDSRGVCYTGILEKQQLVQILNDSAHVVKGEIDEIILPSNSTEKLSTHSPPSSLLTSGSHFNEKVEDTKDSVWLVQVMPANQKYKEPLLDDYSWQYLKHHLAPFAIQTGVFDCNSDEKLCLKKNWLEPILLLALPRGNRPKDHIIIRTSNTPKIHVIINWVKEQLSSRIKKINSLDELERDWLSPQDTDPCTSVILFTHLVNSPLFFAALSIKFTGRIKFGIFNVKKNDHETEGQLTKVLSKNNKAMKLPSYVVFTPEKKHFYGYQAAEHFNLFYMNIFLKLVQPEMNDVFIVALILINMLATLNICQIRGHTSFLYVIRSILLVITYNLMFFMLSLVLYNLSLDYFDTPVLKQAVSLLRYANFSYVGSLLRADMIMVFQNPMLFMVLFVAYGFLMSHWLINLSDESRWHDWDFLPIGTSYIVNSLFRPIEAPIRNFTNDVNMGNFDLRFEQLVITRSPRIFNIPNLWLQPSPARFDYISDLPVFQFKGWSPCTHKGMALMESVMDGDRDMSQLSSEDETGGEYNCDYLQCRLVRSQDCAICLEAYEYNVVLVALPCAHHFHKGCVMNWLRRGHSQCPICRWHAYKQKYDLHY